MVRVGAADRNKNSDLNERYAVLMGVDTNTIGEGLGCEVLSVFHDSSI